MWIGPVATRPSHTFSAFWLRSSVVSVLISLISDTILIENEDINLIFGVARVASGLPGLPVTGCLCIALQQSTADPARGSTKQRNTHTWRNTVHCTRILFCTSRLTHKLSEPRLVLDPGRPLFLILTWLGCLRDHQGVALGWSMPLHFGDVKPQESS